MHDSYKTRFCSLSGFSIVNFGLLHVVKYVPNFIKFGPVIIIIFFVVEF